MEGFGGSNVEGLDTLCNPSTRRACDPLQVRVLGDALLFSPLCSFSEFRLVRAVVDMCNVGNGVSRFVVERT